jgi:hypothetical protein
VADGQGVPNRRGAAQLVQLPGPTDTAAPPVLQAVGNRPVLATTRCAV